MWRRELAKALDNLRLTGPGPVNTQGGLASEIEL